MIMITFSNMGGKLGNIIYSINTVFRYCDIYNIDYKNICFCDECLGSKNCLSKYLDNILYNVKDFFLPFDIYHQCIKNCRTISYNKCKKYYENINFIGYDWDKNIILNVFYNKEIYENTIKN